MLILTTLFLVSIPVHSLEKKVWEGKTNQKGSVSIKYTISKNRVFILQGHIFTKKSWRPIPVFWDKERIWFDLGPRFKTFPYKINLILY